MASEILECLWKLLSIKNKLAMEKLLFFPVNLLTFYSIMDVVQGIMKCSVIDGASCGFQGCRIPLQEDGGLPKPLKRRPLCLQLQQLSRGRASTRGGQPGHAGPPQSPKRGRGPQRVLGPSAHLSPLSLKIFNCGHHRLSPGRILFCPGGYSKY